MIIIAVVAVVLSCSTCCTKQVLRGRCLYEQVFHCANQSTLHTLQLSDVPFLHLRLHFFFFFFGRTDKKGKALTSQI